MTKLSLNKVESFIKDLEQKPDLKQEFDANPKATLIKQAALNPIKDVWVYRLVVTALSLVILIVVNWPFNKRRKGNNGRTSIYHNKQLGFTIYRCISRIVGTSPRNQEDN